MNNFKSLYLIPFLSITLISSCGKKNSEKPQNSQKTAPISAPIADKPEPKATDSKPIAAVKPDRGRTLYKRCATCHTLNEGERHKVGPNLFGMFGAKAGMKDGFNYSSMMKASDLTWTDENLTAYIQNPRAFMPGNRMSFVGIRKSEDVDALLNYMKKEMTKE